MLTKLTVCNRVCLQPELSQSKLWFKDQIIFLLYFVPHSQAGPAQIILSVIGVLHVISILYKIYAIKKKKWDQAIKGGVCILVHQWNSMPNPPTPPPVCTGLCPGSDAAEVSRQNTGLTHSAQLRLPPTALEGGVGFLTFFRRLPRNQAEEGAEVPYQSKVFEVFQWIKGCEEVL